MRTPIFLTGLPRSGTTWVGQVLTADPSVFAVNEPFNPKTPQHLPLDYPARYLEPETPLVVSPALRRSVSALLRLRVRVPRRFPADKPRQVLRNFRDTGRTLAAKARGATVVIKDPTANFLTSWLHREFGVQPAVLVRHPCGNAAGYVRMGWSGVSYLDRPGPVAQLRPQDHEYVQPYRDQLAGDPVLSAALDWRLTNGMLLGLRELVPDLIVVRYEDLAQDPERNFPELTGKLGLPWGPANTALLDELRGVELPQDALGSKLHVMKRDPAAAASSWRQRLSDAEVARVLEHAGPLAEELGYRP